MKRTMNIIAILSMVSAILCAVFCLFFDSSIIFSLLITFGTIAYHFLMRLFVGFTINGIMKNEVNYKLVWFHPRIWENKLYTKLNVKKLKCYVPTYSPELFNKSIHSWEEIVQASCQAEIVHETIILFSFVPILFSKWFGAAFVFIITSIIAAFLDMIFVVLLRYNRSRMIKVMHR